MTTILLVGPDGTGKSTASNWVRHHYLVTRHEHYRPRLRQDPEFDQPHSKETRSLVASYLKLAFLLAEQIVNRPLRRLAARKGIVLIERGWLDAAIDPLRYRMDPRLTVAVRRLSTLGCGRVDLALVLTAPASTIHARKPELDVTEIQRQIDAWLDLVKTSATNFKILPTSNLDETSTVLSGALQEHAGRWRKP